MALRVLVASPFFEEHRTLARQLADGILSLVRPNGGFRAWFIDPPSGRSNENYFLTFYSGEAILSLIEYAERSKDDAYLRQAGRIQEFYLRRYVDHMRAAFYPAYVPWHTMSLNQLYKRFKDPRYAAAVVKLNDELLLIQDQDSFPGRFFKPQYEQYGNPHASSDGVYTEGLAYALEVARLAGYS